MRFGNCVKFCLIAFVALVFLSGCLSSSDSPVSASTSSGGGGSVNTPSGSGSSSGGSGGGGSGGSGGSGSNPDDRLSASSFYNMLNDDLDGIHYLPNDIDLTGFDWEPIGTSSNPFTGTIIGEGYKISNLEISSSDNSGVGMFGFANGATFVHFGLIDVNVNIEVTDASANDPSWVGSLVGDCESCNFSVIYVSGNVSYDDIEDDYVGVGGLVGKADSNSFSTVVSNVDVDSDLDESAGGFVGYVVGDIDFNSSLYYGTILNSANVDNGFVAKLHTNSNIYCDGSNVIDSYWDSTLNPSFSNRGNCKGVSSDDLKSVDGSIYADWNSNIWDFGTPNTYPVFSWIDNGVFSSGSGGVRDPFVISSVEQFDSIRYYLDSSFKLSSDIDLSSFDNWNPIGNSSRFTGSLNGDGYSISGFKINSPENDYTGLFAHSDDSTFSNFSLIDFNVSGNDYVGGLVGESKRTYFSSIYLSGNVSGNNSVGGIAGAFHGNTNVLNNSVSSVNVSGNNFAGGFVGTFNVALISNSLYHSGVVSGDKSFGYDYFFGKVISYDSRKSCFNSYWDSGSENLDDYKCPRGVLSSRLKESDNSPNSYFEYWDSDVWDFGEAGDYPSLKVLRG